MVAVVRALVIEFLGNILYFTRPFCDVFFHFIYRIFMGKTKPLPPIRNKLLLMSATELAEKIRKRQIKCEDVMRAYIERSQEVHPHINAVVDARYEDALQDARNVDRFIESGEKTPDEMAKETPLLGIPFTCKEAIGVKGLAQTAGMYAAKGRVSDKDSDAAALYKAAGAIPVTVTNVPELCMWWDSSNLVFGITQNPWDNARTVGGSTGGEAALLTTAGAIIGIGNDLGGSIRMPSSFNGIYGHKPSSGVRKSLTVLAEIRKSPRVVSNEGEFPHNKEESGKIDHFLSTGPMCRYVEDLPLLLKILSGNDQRLEMGEKVNFRNVKVYYMEETPDNSSVKAIKQSIRKAAAHFEEEYGIKTIPLKLEEMRGLMYMWECKFLETNVLPFKLVLADEKGHVNLWWDLIKSIFRLATHTLPIIFFAMIERREKDQFYYDGLKKYDKLEQKFLEIFEEDAIVLFPTHPEPPPFRHLTIPKYVNVSYTAIFNILGFPSTNIPAGFCDGLPIGIQAISGHFKDHLTIATAIELNKVFGGWKSPSAVAV